VDEIVHQPIRLKIMAALNALRSGETLDFSSLKTLIGATDGNLGAHLTTLEDAGYVAVTKDFVARKPRTQVSLTRAGRKAFAQHVAELRDIIDASDR
jgi:DNA-binding MarR family transcriptional regulator